MAEIAKTLKKDMEQSGGYFDFWIKSMQGIIVRNPLGDSWMEHGNRVHKYYFLDLPENFTNEEYEELDDYIKQIEKEYDIDLSTTNS